MAGKCSPRGGLGHAKPVSLACVLLGVLGVLRGAAGGFVHPPPLHHPFGAVGPLTVVRHAPPAVPPYSTQVNIFRWLAAFPPPVLHRALVLAHGPPLHGPPVLHHAPLPLPPPPPPAAVVPTAPVLPPPPPPLVPAVVKTPVAQLPLGFNLAGLGTPLNFPLGPGFNFPPEALPFAPGLLPTSAFLPTRGLHPAPLPAAPFPAPAFPAPLPAAFPAPVSPTLRTPFGLSPFGLAGFNGLLPTSAFLPGGSFAPAGPALPPVNFDVGVAARAPPPPVALPTPTPTPVAGNLVFQDGFQGHLRQDGSQGHLRQDGFQGHLRQDGFQGHLRQDGFHHGHLRQYGVPAANGITRATAGNLAL